jgi:membrane protease subunit HflK
MSAPAPGLIQTPEPPRAWNSRRIGASLVGLWILSGAYVVRPEQQAVITRFGAVSDSRVFPGIHYALPWPLESVTKVKVNQLQRLVVGGDTADSVMGRTQPLVSQFLTGDQNIISMRVVVQYSVAVPADYLFRSADVGKVVGSAVEAELARRVALRDVDAVLTTERGAVQDEVLGRAQAVLNGYGAGVRLSTVNIESAVPPPEAATAFRDVASARADTARIIDEAHGYANDLLPRARGEAAQTRQSADAYRQSRTNEALGDAARFTAVEAEYARASSVTGHRLYMEAMEQIMPRIRKLIVDADGNLDLSIIGRGETPAK